MKDNLIDKFLSKIVKYLFGRNEVDQSCCRWIFKKIVLSHSDWKKSSKKVIRSFHCRRFLLSMTSQNILFYLLVVAAAASVTAPIFEMKSWKGFWWNQKSFFSKNTGRARETFFWARSFSSTYVSSTNKIPIWSHFGSVAAMRRWERGRLRERERNVWKHLRGRGRVSGQRERACVHEWGRECVRVCERERVVSANCSGETCQRTSGQVAAPMGSFFTTPPPPATNPVPSEVPPELSHPPEQILWHQKQRFLTFFPSVRVGPSTTTTTTLVTLTRRCFAIAWLFNFLLKVATAAEDFESDWSEKKSSRNFWPKIRQRQKKSRNFKK